VQPDLYDTLVGNDAEALMSLYETEANLKNKIDAILLQSEDPVIKEMIRTKTLVRVRETMFTKIMTVFDNVMITGNDKNNTTLKAA